MSSEPFLILHKVRGEPAFDIAIECEDMGTETDPGPWWIVPTSGHRAYPLEVHPLNTFNFTTLSLDEANVIYHEAWINLPDHCQHSIDRTASVDKTPIQSLDVANALANLIKPQAPLVRRKI